METLAAALASMLLASRRRPFHLVVYMTPLARSQGDQFIDLLGEAAESRPSTAPGYRRQPKPDWFSEFADEAKATASELVLPDPPLSLLREPERITRDRTTGRLGVLGPMVLLAGIAAAIGINSSIVVPGDLPVVPRPAVPLQTAPATLPAPQVPVVTSEPETKAAESETTNPGVSRQDQVIHAPRTGPVITLSASATPREVETFAVQDVLDRYRAAFSTTSTDGMKDFWPNADMAALARTFDEFRSLRFDFNSCGVELSAGERATGRCTGRATFVPRAGGPVRVESRAWSFALSRVDGRWIIVKADMSVLR